MHNILAVQRVLRRHAVDRFLDAQPVRVVHNRRHARFLHLLQLPAVLPSVRPRRAIFAGTGIAVVVDLHQRTKRIVGVARPLAVDG